MKFYYFLLAFLLSTSSQQALSSQSTHTPELDKYLPHDNILIATHLEPPFVYLEGETFLGSNVEIAKLLAARMNKTIEFIYCPFARCLAMTREGKADMMLTVLKNEERKGFLSYLEQPVHSLVSPVRFYLKKDNHLTIESYEDLDKLSVGVLRGATYFERFDEDEALTKVAIKSHAGLIEMLLKNRIDTFLGKESSIEVVAEDDVYENEIKMAPYIYNKKSDFYIAISKKSPLNKEVAEFSKALKQLMANGDIDNILAKYP